MQQQTFQDRGVLNQQVGDRGHNSSAKAVILSSYKIPSSARLLTFLRTFNFVRVFSVLNVYETLTMSSCPPRWSPHERALLFACVQHCHETQLSLEKNLPEMLQRVGESSVFHRISNARTWKAIWNYLHKQEPKRTTRRFEQEGISFLSLDPDVMDYIAAYSDEILRQAPSLHSPTETGTTSAVDHDNARGSAIVSCSADTLQVC